MTINFTTNIEKYTTTSTTHRASNFHNFASKKQLQNACILDDEALDFILSIRNVFNLAIHKDLQYAAVTLYYASTKKYGFLILDLQNKAVAECESIKQAKDAILALMYEQHNQE